MMEGYHYQVCCNFLRVKTFQELKETADDAQAACSTQAVICREMSEATTRPSDC